MSGTDKHQKTSQRGEESDPLGELFRHASARKQPPAEDEKFVRETLHGQWRAMTRRSRRLRKAWPWAVAASVLLAAVMGVHLSQGPSLVAPAQRVAVADKIVGQVMLRAKAGSRVLRDEGDLWLLSGQTISLGGNARLSVSWVNGAAIRLDEVTEVELVSPDELFLISGRIYVDTAMNGGAETPITVRTPHGVVRHLGTQFMTRVSSNGTSVSVREGQVAYFPSVHREAERTLAVQGQLLAVTASGDIAIEPIETWGLEWEWAEQMSAGFASDGRSLADLLAWVGRESGRRVYYSSSRVESIAESTILHGDLDLQPMQALSVATATTDLQAEVEDGLIVVRLQDHP